MQTRASRSVAWAIVLAFLPAVAHGAVASRVATGDEFQCVLSDTGALSCWGRNFFGQLGTGDTIDRGSPVTVSGLGSGVATMSAGRYHACAVTTAGGLKCWGSNYNGQLGDGTTNDTSTPQDVPGLTSGVATVATGDSSTCALTTTGGVTCWGSAPPGVGSSPATVPGLASGVVAIASGAGHRCALTSAGGVECWGANQFGQLGDGTNASSTTPVNVSGLASGVASITAGWNSTCAVTTAGAAKCWGYNGKGAVGDGTNVDRWVPTDVVGLGAGVARITAERRQDAYNNDNVTCAVTTAGALWCWTAYPLVPVADPYFTSDVASVASGTNIWVVTTSGQLRQRYGASGWRAGCVRGFGDADGDELCDTYDACATQSDRQQFPYLQFNRQAKMVFSRINTETTPGNDQLVLKGRFELPVGKTFADLDPAVTGARIVTLSPNGATSSFAMPGGMYGGKGTAGWTQVGGAKPHWDFKDSTGAPGTKTVTVAKLTGYGPGEAGDVIDVGLTARAGSFPIGPDDFPIQVQVLLDDSTPGANGLCGEGRFNCECRFGVSGKALNCNANLRRPEVCD